MNTQQAVQQLRDDVALFARPEGRMVGTAGHKQARRDLVARLTALGLRPYAGDGFELPYEVEGTAYCNILGRLPGLDASLPPVVLVAHYDTVIRYAGADDNAAAMAILLASVEPLRSRKLARDVVFAFFDAEEPPHFLTPRMGSIHFYNHQRRGPVHCAVVLDLVGHDVQIPGFEDLLFITGMESDAGLAEVIQDTKARGLKPLPTLNAYVGDLSDHHVFRINQRPYLFLTCAHSPDYHRPTDTPDKLNYEKMAAIRNYLLGLTERIAQLSLEGPFEGYDSAPVEIAFMKRNMGPILAMFGLSAQSREDIERIAKLFVSQFQL
ncbi:MAG: M28 family peptidase [FCB group bacterium]|jgi:hypothetical protein|nr:M28 family peptidase [FCB group bacterium]